MWILNRSTGNLFTWGYSTGSKDPLAPEEHSTTRLLGGLMFIVTYSCKVPKDKTKAYLDLQKEVKKIYMKQGCLSYEVFETPDKDEQWLEIGRFESKSHFKKVIARVDKDPEIPELYKRFCSIVEITKNPVLTKEYIRRI
jgi:quinol monooxygenase YgiN